MEDHPLTPNAPGGGPSTMRHHLEVLTGCNVDVALLMIVDPAASFGFEQFAQDHPDEYAALEARCESVGLVRVHRRRGRLRLASRMSGAALDPISYLSSHLDRRSLARLSEAIAAIDPDMIWAENLLPTALALSTGCGRPVIYSHHDWLWRVWTHSSRHKGATWRTRAVCWLMKRAEEALVRRVRAIVTTSVIEAGQLRQFNPAVTYVAPGYSPVDIDPHALPAREARVVHVGGMTTSSNRIGLERFLDIAWPIVCESSPVAPDLWVIGDLADASASLMQKLHRHGAVQPGFVDRLSGVLRSYDIHIVPWEHATGTRTKIPMAFNHAQVVVSMAASRQALPELVHGENCVLVESLHDMARAIRSLIGDPMRRKHIGDAARRTFLAHSTHASARPHVEALLRDLRQPSPDLVGSAA
jgi:hypothetical protein